MQSKSDILRIVTLEVTDELKKRAREDFNGRFNTPYRIVVSFGATVDTLTDEQRKLFDRLSERQQKAMLANAIPDTYSGVFDMSNIIHYYKRADGKGETVFRSKAKKDSSGEPVEIDKPFVTKDGGFTDEEIDSYFSALKEEFAAIDYQLLFTGYKFTVKELLVGTKYEGIESVYYDTGETDENGQTIFNALSTQKRLYIGFYTDTQRAFDLCKEHLLDGIDEGDLLVSLPKQKPQQEQQSNNVQQPLDL